MALVDGLLKHEFNNPNADDGGPHDHTLNSDWNNGHVFAGGSFDGDVLSWHAANASKGKFRTIVGSGSISVAVNSTQIVIGFTGGFISPANGGTGLDTSASNGVPSINAGSWIINNVLTASRVLVAAAGNQVQSFAALTYDGLSFAVTSAGPHSFGAAVNANAQMLIGGSFASAGAQIRALLVNSTLSPAANADAYAVSLGSTINEAGGGTHADFATLFVTPPVVNPGAAALTNATTLKISAAPTAGANNRALWVLAGLSHFSADAAPAILVQPTGAVNAEFWMRHGSSANSMKLIVDSSFNLSIQTNNTLAIRVAGSTQATEHHGVGPHSFGGNPTTSAQLTLTGTWTGAGQTEMLRAATTLQSLAGVNTFGLIFVPNIIEAGSGVHGQLTGIYVLPTFTNAGGSTTNVYGINIDTIATGVITPTNAAALRIASPTGATNNYLILSDAGNAMIRIASAGPYSFGGNENLQIQFFFQGTHTSNAADSKGMQLQSSVNAGADSGSLIGLFVAPTLVERGGGTHPIEAGIYVSPAFTNGGAACTNAAGIYVESITAAAGTVTASGIFVKVPSGATTNYGIYVNSGVVKVEHHIRTTAPNTRTTSPYSLVVSDNYIISDQAGTLTVTLPTASANTGREIWFQTYQAQTVVSDASNVVPKGGGAAGTAILPGTDGAWAMIVSDGANWVIMASGT